MKYIKYVYILSAGIMACANNTFTTNQSNTEIYSNDRIQQYVEKTKDLADSYRDNGNFTRALELYMQAHNESPSDLQLIMTIANTHLMQYDYQSALDWYKKGLDINPTILSLRYNSAHVLKRIGKLDEAIEIYKEIILQRPGYAKAHFGLGLALLKSGDFKNGWREHEWRWAAYNETPRNYEQPLWDGSDPAGKTIFLYAEQGLGDTLQFVRYAQIIKERGGTVIVNPQKPLVDVLKLCPYIDHIVVAGDFVPSFDYQIPIMSLPLACGTTRDTVPNEIPYLHANSDLIDYWGEQLAQDTNFKIGICWQGNPNYATQALRQEVKLKSCPLHLFEPIANVPGVSLYSLQKMSGEEQINQLQDNVFVHTFDGDFDDSHGRFMDTAAVIQQLDLIITIDTSIAHLAGGLGARTWLLLPKPSDWRWIIDRTDTPWYPNMRLFQQPTNGDWQSVMHTVADKLTQLITEGENHA